LTELPYQKPSPFISAAWWHAAWPSALVNSLRRSSNANRRFYCITDHFLGRIWGTHTPLLKNGHKNRDIHSYYQKNAPPNISTSVGYQKSSPVNIPTSLPYQNNSPVKHIHNPKPPEKKRHAHAVPVKG
jgi:hypothetical protein